MNALSARLGTWTSPAASLGSFCPWATLLEASRELSLELPTASGEACSINAPALASADCRRALRAQSFHAPVPAPSAASFRSFSSDHTGSHDQLHGRPVTPQPSGAAGYNAEWVGADTLRQLARCWQSFSLTTSCHSNHADATTAPSAHNSSTAGNGSSPESAGTSANSSYTGAPQDPAQAAPHPAAASHAAQQLVEWTCTVLDRQNAATAAGFKARPADPDTAATYAQIISAAAAYYQGGQPPTDLWRSLVAAAAASAQTAPWPAATQILQGLTQMGTVGTRYLDATLHRIEDIPLRRPPRGGRRGHYPPPGGWMSADQYAGGGCEPGGTGPSAADAVSLLHSLCVVHAVGGAARRNLPPAMQRLMRYLGTEMLEALPGGPAALLPLLHVITSCGWDHSKDPSFMHRVGNYLSSPALQVGAEASSAHPEGAERASLAPLGPSASVTSAAVVAAVSEEDVLIRGPRLLALTPSQLVTVLDQFRQAGVHHSDLMERALDAVDRCLPAFTPSQATRVAECCARFAHHRPALMRRLGMQVGAHLLTAAVPPTDVAGMVVAMARCRVGEETFMQAASVYATGHAEAWLERAEQAAAATAETEAEAGARLEPGESGDQQHTRAGVLEVPGVAGCEGLGAGLRHGRVQLPRTATGGSGQVIAAEHDAGGLRAVHHATDPSGARLTAAVLGGAPVSQALPQLQEQQQLLRSGQGGGLEAQCRLTDGLHTAEGSPRQGILQEEARAGRTAAAEQQQLEASPHAASADGVSDLESLLSQPSEPPTPPRAPLGAASVACETAASPLPGLVRAGTPYRAEQCVHAVGASPPPAAAEEPPTAAAATVVRAAAPLPTAATSPEAIVATAAEVAAATAEEVAAPHIATGVSPEAIAAAIRDGRTTLMLQRVPYDLPPQKLLDELLAIPGAVLEMFYMPYKYDAVATGAPGEGMAYVSVADPQSAAAILGRLNAGPLSGMPKKLWVDYCRERNTSALVHTLMNLAPPHKAYTSRSKTTRSRPVLLYTSGSLRGKVQPLDPSDVVIFAWPHKARRAVAGAPCPSLVQAGERHKQQEQPQHEQRRVEGQSEGERASGLGGRAERGAVADPACQDVLGPAGGTCSEDDQALQAAEGTHLDAPAELLSPGSHGLSVPSEPSSGAVAVSPGSSLGVLSRLQEGEAAAATAAAPTAAPRVEGSPAGLLPLLRPSHIALMAHSMAALSFHHPGLLDALARLMRALVVVPVRRDPGLAAALLTQPMEDDRGFPVAQSRATEDSVDGGGDASGHAGICPTPAPLPLPSIKALLHSLHAITSRPDPDPAAFHELAAVCAAAMRAWLPAGELAELSLAADPGAGTPSVAGGQPPIARTNGEPRAPVAPVAVPTGNLVARAKAAKAARAGSPAPPPPAALPLPPTDILDIYVKLLAQTLTAAADHGPGLHSPALCATAGALLRFHLHCIRPRAACALLQPLVCFDPAACRQLVRAIAPLLAQQTERLTAPSLVSLTWACAKTGFRDDRAVVWALAERTVQMLQDLPTASAAQTFWALSVLRPARGGSDVRGGSAGARRRSRDSSAAADAAGSYASGGGERVLYQAYEGLMHALLNRYDLTARDLLLVQEGLRLSGADQKAAMAAFLKELLSRAGQRQAAAAAATGAQAPAPGPVRRPAPAVARDGVAAPAPVSTRGSAGGAEVAEQAAAQELTSWAAKEGARLQSETDTAAYVECRSLGPENHACISNQVSAKPVQAAGADWAGAPPPPPPQQQQQQQQAAQAAVPQQALPRPLTPPGPPSGPATTGCTYTTDSCGAERKDVGGSGQGDAGAGGPHSAQNRDAGGPHSGQGRDAGEGEGEEAAALLVRGLLREIMLARQGLAMEEAGGVVVRLQVPAGLEARTQSVAWG